MDTARQPVKTPGPLAALRVRTFQVLMGVQLANAVAVWVHVVSVQWILTERGESATVVSLAPAAVALPFLALALPVGVVVGFASRERLMMLATLASGTSAAVGAVLASTGVDHAALVLATVVVVGAALVVVGVAWQSLLPETVGRALVPSAAVVDGAAYNIARALGPLLAGIGLGLQGPAVVFGLVALLFGSCTVVLLLVQVRSPGRRGPRRPIVPAIRGAMRFTRHSPWTTRLLLRMTMFGLPASALWALVSLVVHDRLQLGSRGFGVMMALLGLGAVAATLLLARLRQRLSVRVFAALGSVAYAATLAAIGLSTVPVVVAVFLVIGGIAWVAVQSTWMMLAPPGTARLGASPDHRPGAVPLPGDPGGGVGAVGRRRRRRRAARRAAVCLVPDAALGGGPAALRVGVQRRDRAPPGRSRRLHRRAGLRCFSG